MFRWRNTVRIICAICWAVAIPMFFVPEPIRNETNRLAAEQLAAEEAAKAEVEFDTISERDDDDS